MCPSLSPVSRHCMSPVSHVFCYTLCQTEKHLLNKSIVWSLVCNKKCAVSVFDWYSHCTNSVKWSTPVFHWCSHRKLREPVIVCLYDSVLSEKLMSVCQSCLALSTACERPAWCNLLILLFPGKQEEPPLGYTSTRPNSPGNLHPVTMDLINNRGINLLLNFLLIVVALLLMLILVKLMWPDMARNKRLLLSPPPKPV